MEKMDAERLRILIPTVDYPPIEGGIATVAYRLSRELAALGHDVTVVAPHFPGMEDFDAAEPARVLRFPGYGLGCFRLVPFLHKTWPFLRESDLVLAINVAYGGLLSRLGKARYATPYVAFAYAYEFLKYEKSWGIVPLLRSVYRGAETVVAISHFTRDHLERFGIASSRVCVIPPGAPPAREVAPKALAKLRTRYELGDSKIVLAVGRFMPRKGHLTLVHAMPRLLEQCPNTHLIMAGRGDTRAACLAKAAALGLEGQVHCPGYVDEDELAALYATCDLFALPTGEDAKGQVEGFGLVFAEAHAYGKPVVAGRAGGVVDAVLDGETGLLVPPENPEALASAIASLLHDPRRARRMGEAGKRRVREELNWAVFTRRVLEAAGHAVPESGAVDG